MTMVAIGSRAAQKQATRRRILDLAAQIIGEKGYYGFSLHDLAQRCGLTNGGLLYHFASKDSLLVAVLRDRDTKNTEAIMAEFGHDIDAYADLDVLIKTLHAIAVRASRQPELVRLFAMLQGEALSPEHPAHSFFEDRDTALQAGFAGMVAPHVGDPQATACQLLAMLSGLELVWLKSKCNLDLVELWDRSLALLLPVPSGARG